jgi:hypothetical protein
MKIQFRTSRFITGVTAVCVLAIATTASAKNPKAVELSISGDKLSMDTSKGKNDCQLFTSRNKGCIRLKRNEKSKIEFHLTGEANCTLESGTKWKLNAVYLGGFNSDSKPTEGFGFTSDANFDKVNKDFNGVNKMSGLVTPVDKRDKKITINDKNENKYNVWYKIEAICEREDGEAAHTTSFDPRVRNGGTE